MENTDDAGKHWTIDVYIDEHNDRTRATARLHNCDEIGVVGTGLARLNRSDIISPRSATSSPRRVR